MRAVDVTVKLILGRSAMVVLKVILVTDIFEFDLN